MGVSGHPSCTGNHDSHLSSKRPPLHPQNQVNHMQELQELPSNMVPCDSSQASGCGKKEITWRILIWGDSENSDCGSGQKAMMSPHLQMYFLPRADVPVHGALGHGLAIDFLEKSRPCVWPPTQGRQMVQTQGMLREKALTETPSLLPANSCDRNIAEREGPRRDLCQCSFVLF